MTTKDLLNTLEDLSNEEFTKFKWYLKQPDMLGGYQPIKASKLETADRLKTVDLMVNAFKSHGALKVTKKVLEEIPRKDLVQSLSDPGSGPEDSQRNIPAEDSVPAEVRLFSARSQFVNRVSEPVLNQLLDKLLESGVINIEEMDSVIAKAHKAEKARDVIETVRRRGTKASSVLIAALWEVDPCLSRELKLR